MKHFLTMILAAGLFLTSNANVFAKEDAKKPAKTAQAKVIDPVCGMEVDPKTAEKAVYQGKEYYFCSRDDKAAFEKTPEKYLAKTKKK